MKKANIFKLTSMAALLVAMSDSVLAGPTANLQVKGTITPAACTPTLGNGGIVDFGVTSSSELAKGSLKLKYKVVQLSVTCTAPTKISFTVTDNRQDSVVLGLTGYNNSNLGLGKTTDQKNIGAFQICPGGAATVDGNAASPVFSNDLVTWAASPGVTCIDTFGTEGADRNVSVALNSDKRTPVAFTEMTMDLGIMPFISDTMKDITEVQNLDGNATLNFDYM